MEMINCNILYNLQSFACFSASYNKKNVTGQCQTSFGTLYVIQKATRHNVCQIWYMRQKAIRHNCLPAVNKIHNKNTQTQYIRCRSLYGLYRRTNETVFFLVAQELLTILDTLCSSPVFSGVCFTLSLVFFVMFLRSLFVSLSLFFWSLYSLSFYDLWLLITTFGICQSFHFRLVIRCQRPKSV